MKEIFVFGSNLAGVHGAGAALHARKHHGAVVGRGIGLQGSSYAIPTKDERIKTLPLHEIRPHVETFLSFAAAHPEMRFLMTRIGCGLAGYSDKDIAPMFAKVPSNVVLPPEWVDFLRRTGTCFMTLIINRILVWLAVHLQMVIVADWTPQPHVHLFKSYKDACNYAWHPEHAGTEIIDTRLFPEWVEPLKTELERE